MRTRVVCLALTAGVAGALAQQARMADGHPDLQGTYDLATLTPIERVAGAQPTLTPEEAAKLEKLAAALKKQGDDGSVGPAGNVGGYNTFWLDPGSSYTIVDGQKRTSLVIDPPDGRVPPY